MIKLIVSDLDGTLLPPSKILPEETFPLIERLYDKGVVFAPASGRQLPNLKKLFEPVLDKIAIIAENGGLVWYGGEVVYSNPTDKEDVLRAVGIIRAQKDLYPVISCAERAYFEDSLPRFVETVKRSYSSVCKVENLDEVAKNETALKISVWDARPAAEHGEVVLPPLIEGLKTRISGYDWLDVSRSDSNKGKALTALMRRVGAKKGECAAFGDHMNDLEMLQNSGLPFVTANAYPPLKNLVNGEVVASNANEGVIKKIKEFL